MTIKDVAKYCNVSVTTVSYALNDSPEISKETKEKIKKAAIELDYHPSSYAKGLKTKKTNNIGVFISGFEGPIHSQVLSGIATALVEHSIKYNMLVMVAEQSINLVKEKLFDLAIIMDSKVTNEVITNLSKSIPIVTFDVAIEGDNIYPTRINNTDVVYHITKDLINKGCKKIAYLLGSSMSNHNRLRFMGYQKALSEANIAINQNLIYDANAFTIERGYDAISKVIANQKELPFDALVCGNDELAIGAINALNEKGFKAPKDFRISGFDNIKQSTFVNPPLTTATIDWYQYGIKMGRYATNILEKKLNNNEPLNIDAQIVERDSTK